MHKKQVFRPDKRPNASPCWMLDGCPGLAPRLNTLVYRLEWVFSIVRKARKSYGREGLVPKRVFVKRSFEIRILWDAKRIRQCMTDIDKDVVVHVVSFSLVSLASISELGEKVVEAEQHVVVDNLGQCTSPAICK